MSLLMDALKKAELAKSRSPDAAASTTPIYDAADSAIDAAEYKAGIPDSSPATVLPPLTGRLELLDDEFIASAAKSPRPLPTATGSSVSLTAAETRSAPSSQKSLDENAALAKADDARKEAVKNLFETKQPTSRKKSALLIAGFTLLAAASIGLYFWNELRPKSGLTAGNMAQRPLPVTAAHPISPPPPLPPPPAITSAPIPVATEAGPSPTAATSGDQEKVRRQDEATDELSKTAPPKKLFRVGSPPLPSNKSLDRAYAALTQGDLASAKTAYHEALAADAKNSDALAGLAAIATRTGNPQLAADYYLQMLEGDPKNPIAQAGLVDLQSQMDPAIAESRLKQALGTQPDAAALNFSLGNTYARGKRWAEAQQAYFKAASGDPGNPDYLFNLAVSLDQMRQPRLAANYYVQALAAADSRPAAFDRAQVRERLQKLPPQP